MANLYFEFDQSIVDMKLAPHKYVTTVAQPSDPVTRRWSEYTMNANRVWCEQDGHVWFIKHRTIHHPKVDMTEFMWIKLSSAVVD